MLQSEPYEIEQRLRTTHFEYVVPFHRLMYCLLLILRGQPQVKVFYDETAEATNRIAVDMMLIASRHRTLSYHFPQPKQKLKDREIVKDYP